MANTYSQLLTHIVFSTKCRQRWLAPIIRPKLFAYFGGILRNENAHLIAAGGVEDHVHLLIQYRTDHAIANLVRPLKSRSSAWLKQTVNDLTSFQWQDGYAAFSVSQSVVPEVMAYIHNQVEHHRERDFMTELLLMLDKHGIDYRREYVFD
jgi:putative transposase